MMKRVLCVGVGVGVSVGEGVGVRVVGYIAKI